MNKIFVTKNWLAKKNWTLIRPEMRLVMFFSNGNKKNKDKGELELEERYKNGDAVFHDKQQSVQEESFFHKETQEQLKALKKKQRKKTEKSKHDEEGHE